MSNQNKYTNLSLYLGQSSTGIGIDGSGKSAADGGEQYLKVDDKLRDARLLNAIKSWLTLDSKASDHKKLNDRLESWSYFTEGNLVFVCRLVSAGVHGEGNREAYFSHARAWTKGSLSGLYFDPGLYLGSSDNFEKPWRDNEKGTRIPQLSDMESLQKTLANLTINEQHLVDSYLSYLLYGLLKKIKIVIIAPISQFEIGSKLHSIASLVRALLPTPYRDNCNTRIYCSENINSFVSKSNFLIIPDYFKKDVQKYKNMLVLDLEGNCIHGQYTVDPSINALTSTYSKYAIKQFYQHKRSIPFFSKKSGEILEKYISKKTSFTPEIFKILTIFSFELSHIYDKSDKEKFNFLEKWGVNEQQIDWNVFVNDNDLEEFNKSDLLKLALKRYDSSLIANLQNRITKYLEEKLGSEGIDKLLEDKTIDLSRDLFYKRTDKLAASSDIVTSTLILRVFGRNPPKQYHNAIERALSLEINKSDELPDDIQYLVKNLEVIINTNEEKNDLISKFIETLVGTKQLKHHIDVLKNNLSSENFNHISAYLLDEVFFENKFNSLSKYIIEELDEQYINQEYLQSVLEELLLGKKDNPAEKHTAYIYKTHQLATSIAKKLTQDRKTPTLLKEVWRRIKENSNNLSDAQILDLLSPSNYSIEPQFLLDMDGRIDSSWLEKYPRTLITNNKINQNINTSQLMDIVVRLSSDSYNDLRHQDILLLASRIDEELKKKTGHELALLKELLNKNLWIAWRANTKLPDTILYDLSIFGIIDLYHDIRSLEIWDKLIIDCKLHGIEWHNIENKNFIPSKPAKEDVFISKKFHDLIQLSKDYSSIFKFYQAFYNDINPLELFGITKKIRPTDSELYLRILELSENINNTPTYTDISELDKLKKEKNDKLKEICIEHLPKIFMHNIEKSPSNHIEENLQKIQLLDFFSDTGFKSELDILIIRLAKENKERALTLSNFCDKYGYSLPGEIVEQDNEFTERAYRRINDIPTHIKIKQGSITIEIPLEKLYNQLLDEVEINKSLSILIEDSPDYSKEIKKKSAAFFATTDIFKNSSDNPPYIMSYFTGGDREFKQDHLTNYSKLVGFLKNCQKTLITEEKSLLSILKVNPSIMKDLADFLESKENNNISFEDSCNYLFYPLVNNLTDYNTIYEHHNSDGKTFYIAHILVPLSRRISSEKFKYIIKNKIIEGLSKNKEFKILYNNDRTFWGFMPDIIKMKENKSHYNDMPVKLKYNRSNRNKGEKY